jgi:hypothetical protein
MAVVLHHEDAELTIEDCGTSRLCSVQPRQCIFLPFHSCVTNYSVDAIADIFGQKGAWVVDHIMRDESSNYMRDLYWELLERGITRAR